MSMSPSLRYPGLRGSIHMRDFSNTIPTTYPTYHSTLLLRSHSLCLFPWSRCRLSIRLHYTTLCLFPLSVRSIRPSFYLLFLCFVSYLSSLFTSTHPLIHTHLHAFRHTSIHTSIHHTHPTPHPYPYYLYLTFLYSAPVNNKPINQSINQSINQ
ncbi:hypothetical protein BDW42DRAFT_181362, partial [Aspergillus taichungensis]